MREAHRLIARGIAVTLLLVLLGRAVGAAREITVAARLGTGELADAYFFVLTVVSWPVGIWFNVLATVLVPHVHALRQTGSVKTLDAFRENLFGLTLLAALGCGLLFWIGLGSDVFLRWLGFPNQALVLTRQLSIWLLPIIPIGFMSSYFSAWMMSSGGYVYTLFEAAPSLCILIGLLLFTQNETASLVWGTLIGFLLQLILLLAALAVKREVSRPRLDLRGPEWHRFGTNFGILGLGQVFMAASILIDQAMAAALDPGTIATLGYASRILGVLLSIGALSINRATLPMFAKMRAEDNPHLPVVALQWALFVFLLTACAAGLAAVVSPDIVKLLFQRGAFNSEDTYAVARMLAFGLVQVPFYCGGLVLTAHLAASGQYWFMTAVAAGTLLLKPFCNYLLIACLGSAGIVLASSLVYAISMAAMATFLLVQIRRWTEQKVTVWNRA